MNHTARKHSMTSGEPPAFAKAMSPDKTGTSKTLTSGPAAMLQSSAPGRGGGLT